MLEATLPALSSLGRHAPNRNQLLSALPFGELERLRPHLDSVSLHQREILYRAGTPISFVYFPETAVISLVTPIAGGAKIEIGTAGCEGMIGLPVFLASDHSSVEAVTQIPGVAQRMEAAIFARFAGAPGVLHRVLLHYTQALLTQVSQTAACNAAHLVEERCARWLLMTHDRVASDEFPLTHEFLAFMLGVRRPGITMAMRALRSTGVVTYRRGSVQIVDREGLEGASCDCYRVMRSHFEQSMQLGASGAC